jgi:hypothetical protein
MPCYILLFISREKIIPTFQIKFINKFSKDK